MGIAWLRSLCGASGCFSVRVQKGVDMYKSIFTALAAALVLAGCGVGNQQSVNISGSAGNVSQSQSGWSNSQSMSIGNVDGKGASGKAEGAVSATQNAPETGNKQSANVSGSAKVAQSQGGSGNT